MMVATNCFNSGKKRVNRFGIIEYFDSILCYKCKEIGSTVNIISQVRGHNSSLPKHGMNP